VKYIRIKKEDLGFNTLTDSRCCPWSVHYNLNFTEYLTLRDLVEVLVPYSDRLDKEVILFWFIFDCCFKELNFSLLDEVNITRCVILMIHMFSPNQPFRLEIVGVLHPNVERHVPKEVLREELNTVLHFPQVYLFQ